jgi:hypothetical protein
MTSVRFALLKIAVDPPHLICHMSETQDGPLSGLCECVKRSGFHFDRHQIPFDHCVDRRLGFTERRVGCPGRAGEDRHGKSAECAVDVT